MSRATDVRDAVVAELKSRLTGVKVRSVVAPNPTPEELDDGPVLAVRVSNRDITVDMGADTREVVLWCAVFGMVPGSDDFDISVDARRAEELEATDALDDIVEQAIGLFSPQGGELRSIYMAEHRFNTVTQNQAFDADLWNDYGIWGSAFFLSFVDDKDF